MSRLTLSIALNFLTDNFARGVSNVRNGFRSMQMQFLTFAAALGAGGLGLTNLISRMKDTARETSRVTTALKNVSGGSAQFADSQKFLLEMADKYGMEVLSLTGNFAKFTVSASQAGMAMDQQKKIFESVSRAAVGFGLSADETNGVFLALSQMMSKGKISSEELRLQMGEKLPIALEAMAKAVGTTVGGLDDLMKKGKLMSADVLPKFAEALNEMMPNVDTDNLETSLNKLQNAFTAFTQKTGIQDAYKRLVDEVTKLVEIAANNIRSIIAQLIAFVIGAGVGKALKWIAVEIKKSERAAINAARSAARAAGQSFDEAAWRATSATATMTTAFKRAGAAIKATMMSALPTAIITVVASIAMHLANAYSESKRIKKIFSEWKKEAESVTKGIKEVDELERLGRIANNVKNSYDERKGAIEKINKQLNTNFSIDRDTLKINGDINRALRTRIDLLKDAASVEFFQKSKLEAEEKNIRILNKYPGKTLEDKGAFLKQTAKFDKNPIYDPQSVRDLNEYNDNYQIYKRSDENLLRLEKKMLTSGGSSPVSDTPSGTGKKTDIQKAEEDYSESLKEITNQYKNGAIKQQEYWKALDELDRDTFKKLSGLLTPEQAQNNSTFQSAKAGFENPTYSKVDEARENYYKEMNEAAMQSAIGQMTDAELSEAKLRLTRETIKEISAIELKTKADNDYLDTLIDAEKELRKQTKIAGIKQDYDTALEELNNQRAAGLISEKNYNSELNTLTQNTKKLSASVLGASATANEFYNSLSANQKPEKYDFKAEASDILSKHENDPLKAYEALKVSARNSSKEMLKEIDKALEDAPTLELAIDLAKARKSVKDFTDELSIKSIDGFTDAVDDIDGIVSSIERLNGVMDDVDASEWEKIMAVWDTMKSMFDTFMSIADSIKDIVEATRMLSASKQEEMNIDNVVTAQKVANIDTEMAADVTAEGVKKSTAATEIAANTAKAASGAAASVSSIPIAGVGMAVAAVGTILALMNRLPKFENGGIVQGTSTSGDKILARVNAGEMILNKGQQSTLFSLLNSKSSSGGGSGKVEFVIEGSKLKGVLKNHDRKMSKY